LLDADERYEPSLNWEHDEYRWCSVGEAVELLRWPTVAAALQAMLSGRAPHLQADRAAHGDARVVKARPAIP